MAGSRKDELKALFSGGFAASNPVQPSTDDKQQTVREESPPPARSASGAVKAMGLSLGAIAKDAEEARALRQALHDGEHIVLIPADRIEHSFIEDRLQIDGQDDEDFTALVDSIRRSGQQVPVLLRPHPAIEGHYETAYGHRRIRAAAVLGFAVKAIVRPLSDDELVLAQGQENAERRNLSFIERAIFARNLAARGFDRKVIGEALSVQKSELSRLIQVIEAVPERYIRLIGSAPKAGRDRWMKLGELLQNHERRSDADALVTKEGFLSSASDQRFQMLFDGVSRPCQSDASRSTQASAQDLTDAAGRVFARLRRDGRAARIDFATDVDAAFLNEAAGLLAEHYDKFQVARKNRQD